MNIFHESIPLRASLTLRALKGVGAYLTGEGFRYYRMAAYLFALALGLLILGCGLEGLN